MQKLNFNKSMRDGKKIVGVCLPIELVQKLDEKCRRVGINKQTFITLAIHKALHQDEDFIPCATGA